jgi:HEAT repeat protein
MRVLSFLALALAGAGCAVTPATTVHGHPVGYWLRKLQEGDAAGRHQAVRALASAALADKAVLPALTDALTDEEAAVRRESVLALLKAGSAARSAVPTLQERLQDADPTVREYAAKALARIQGST